MVILERRVGCVAVVELIAVKELEPFDFRWPENIELLNVDGHLMHASPTRDFPAGIALVQG